MTEMSRRQRVLAACHGERPDKLPFFHVQYHTQIGWAERECRNKGMGINWQRPPYVEVLRDVEVNEQRSVVDGKTVVRRTFTTPVGSVYEEEWPQPGSGQWIGNRGWRSVQPWLTSRRVKEPADYAVAKYIAEHTEYVADYFPIEQAMDWLGEDGVVLDNLPHSPMQTILIDWIGSEGGHCFYHMMDYPELVDDLYQSVCRSRRPMYEIAAGSPAPITMCGDNVDGFLITPTAFQKYLLPVYEEQAAVLHAAGKLMAVHMDGRLASLKGVIAKSPIDIIDAFHPIPMGDLPLRDALAAWPDKTIWIGFPGGIYELGSQATEEFARDLLREMGSGDRLAVAMSTENQVSNENLLTLASVLETAFLPLQPELGR